MAYDINTQIISAPVSFNNVQTALSTSENRLKYLCTASSINKWSKHKPTHCAGITISETDLTNADYSFNIQTIKSDIPLTASNNIWGYVKPSGGVASPYRLGDFRLYNHSAQPIMAILDDVDSINIYGYNTFKIRVTDDNNTPELSLVDFTNPLLNLTTWIPCIIVRYNNVDYTYKYTGETSVTGAKYITLDFTSAPFNGVTDRVTMQFMHVLASDPDKISGNCFYLPMPLNRIGLKTVTIYNHINLTASISRVSEVYNSGYEDISYYSGIGGEESLRFLVLHNIGNLYFKMTLSNQGTSTENFDLSTLQMKFTTLFTSFTNLEKKPNCYDASFNQIDISISNFVDIPAGGSMILYIGIPSVLLMTDNSTFGPAVAIGVITTSSITITSTRNNNVTELCHVNSLRLQSY